MRFLLARMLIVVCLFSFTPLREMVKLPILIAHYIQHKQMDASLTWAGFFDMHYMHGIVFDDDYEQDMKLPFKTFDFTPLPVFVIQNLKEWMPAIKPVDFVFKSKINSSLLFSFQDAMLTGVFHPPKGI
jgi:hypothetical protein